MMIGIYKITNPKNKIYIGQSINIEKRFGNYKNLRCEKQRKLHSSLKKYGVENHKFEVIHECSENELNDIERYYQELYNVIVNGLNIQLVKSSDNNGLASNETKEILRKINLGKKHSDETKKKMSESQSGIKHPNYGKKLSAELIRKRSEKRNNIILDVNTGVYYFGILEVSSLYNQKPSTLTQRLNGTQKNNTSLIIV